MPGEHETQSTPASAFDVLRAYLEARASFSDEDFDVIRGAFLRKRLAAGEFPQRAGDVPRHAAFVATGCLRNYVIDAKGKEHIVQFAPETWWLWAAAFIGSALVEHAFKFLVGRPRPSGASLGFPSGHTTAAVSLR